MPQLPEMVQAALEPKAYPEVTQGVDLNELKALYPNVNIIHLIVDTQYDPPEDWYIIGMERK